MATQAPALTEAETAVLREFADPHEGDYTMPLAVGGPLRYLARGHLADCLAEARLLHQQERLLFYRLAALLPLGAGPPSDYAQLLRQVCRTRLDALNALQGFHAAPP